MSLQRTGPTLFHVPYPVQDKPEKVLGKQCIHAQKKCLSLLVLRKLILPEPSK